MSVAVGPAPITATPQPFLKSAGAETERLGEPLEIVPVAGGSLVLLEPQPPAGIYAVKSRYGIGPLNRWQSGSPLIIGVRGRHRSPADGERTRHRRRSAHGKVAGERQRKCGDSAGRRDAGERWRTRVARQDHVGKLLGRNPGTTDLNLITSRRGVKRVIPQPVGRERIRERLRQPRVRKNRRERRARLPVAAEVQIRTVAPAIGRPCALKTMSSLREPCASARPANPANRKNADIMQTRGREPAQGALRSVLVQSDHFDESPCERFAL